MSFENPSNEDLLNFENCIRDYLEKNKKIS